MFPAPSLEKRDAFNAKKPWKHPAQPGDMCAFSNYSAYMIFSKSSLEDLNQRLEKSVPPTNFRANIIVEDCEIYAEAQLRALDACTRCVMITVDQSKGVKDKNEEPLATLKKYRLRDPYGQKPCFGVNYALDYPGTIRIGDPVYATLKQ